jgi:hypothetical protein
VHWGTCNAVTTLTVDSKRLENLSQLLGTSHLINLSSAQSLICSISHLIMCEALPIYRDILKARVKVARGRKADRPRDGGNVCVRAMGLVGYN